MEKELKYLHIPEFDSVKTLENVYSNDINKSKVGLLSLTHYSRDFELIEKILLEFFNKNYDYRLILYQCLSRYIELFNDINFKKFLIHVLEGFYSKDERIKDVANDIIRNQFIYSTKSKFYTKKQINQLFKNGEILELFEVIVFSFHYYDVEYKNNLIKKCLKHKEKLIQLCGTFMLESIYIKISDVIFTIEPSIKQLLKNNLNRMGQYKKNIFDNIEFMNEYFNEIIIKNKKGR